MQQWREFKGITITALSNATGINVTTISQAENPKGKVSNPSYDTLTKMLTAFPDLNPDWLLLGTGPMLRDGRELTPKPAAPSTVTDNTEVAGPTSGQETVAVAENILLRQHNEHLTKENARLWELLGKSPGNSNAADQYPTAPTRPIPGFGAARRQELADAFNDYVEGQLYVKELVAELP